MYHSFIFKVSKASILLLVALLIHSAKSEESNDKTNETDFSQWIQGQSLDKPRIFGSAEQATIESSSKDFYSCSQSEADIDKAISLIKIKNSEQTDVKTDFVNIVDNILKIKSEDRLTKALNKLYQLTMNHHQDYIEILRERIASQKPLLATKLKWFQESSLSAIDYLEDDTLTKGSCYSRSSRLIELITNSKITMSNIDLAVEKVANCYPLSNRDKFYKTMQPVYLKHFGSGSAFFLDYMKAKNLYSKSEYVKSIEILEGIIKQADTSVDLRNNARFLVAKNYISLGDHVKALMHQRDYIKERTFVNQRLLESYKDVVLLTYYLGRMDDVIDVTHEATSLFNDKKYENDLDMLHFWQARAYHRLGQVKLAFNKLEMLANNRFSTYYGAIAQAILENKKGKLLEPSVANNVRFTHDWLVNSIAPEDRKRLLWIENLIANGRANDAKCEIEEIKEENSSAVAAKSILHHINNDWLSAVSKYASISREDRATSLPSDFEKILFPKKFVNEVEEVSLKLNVDPDFVFAIMRQESVFNPKAVSKAGAVGLLQLMPTTARLELRKIKNDDFQKQINNFLKNRKVDRTNLKDPFVNISLGIHHINSLFYEYNHNPVFVMTSYNAGPAATKRWKNNLPQDDVLTFIEWIPYSETQLYVKLVLRNYFYYKALYKDRNQNKPDLLDPLVNIAFDYRENINSVKSSKDNL